MPDAPCPQSPPMSLQHCFSAAVSCASGMAHAMIGPPNRRTAMRTRKLMISFIAYARIHYFHPCLMLSDQPKFQKKPSFFREQKGYWLCAVAIPSGVAHLLTSSGALTWHAGGRFLASMLPIVCAMGECDFFGAKSSMPCPKLRTWVRG